MERFDLLEGYTSFEEIEEKENAEFELESAPFSAVKTKTEKDDDEDIKLDFIIIKTEHEGFNCDAESSSFKLCGKSLLEWVINATENPTIISDTELGVVNTVKPVLKDGEYTVVLYSDTPLITKNLIKEVVGFTRDKGLNVCKLTRGYVFKTEYIKRVDEIYSPQVYYFDEEDLIIVSNFKQLSLVCETMRNRIISFHMSNGVQINDPSTTYIDSDVTIGKNVIIDKNVKISGTCEICESVIIGCDTYICDARIGEGTKIIGAFIESSVIGENNNISYGVKIVGGTIIDDKVVIDASSILNHCNIHCNCNIGYLCNLKNTEMAEAIMGNNVVCSSTKAINKVRIMKGACVKDSALIVAPYVVDEDVTICEGEFCKKSVQG
ncbi:MAG: hypothetical protein RR334_00160 [Clostridia bacterium]